MLSASTSFNFGIKAVAKVVKTFGDLRPGPKLLTSFATLKLKLDEALACQHRCKSFTRYRFVLVGCPKMALPN
jgi:hypothetical protein